MAQLQHKPPLQKADGSGRADEQLGVQPSAAGFADSVADAVLLLMLLTCKLSKIGRCWHVNDGEDGDDDDGDDEGAATGNYDDDADE